LNFKSRHIAAFTIWEALVAMIITSVIVAMSYKVYLLASKAIYTDHKKLSDLEEMIRFEKIIDQEVISSDFILLDGDKIHFESHFPWLMESTDSVIMVFDGNEELIYKYALEEISVGYLDSISDIINSLDIRINHNGIKYQMSFKKTYSNAFQLKQKD
jgi:type II secretory pathway component PulJ